ncbi:hypothetical protein IF650_13150 [Cellulosimicrobium terreum]|nr:hypothetical protein [Cellulosimicrobium terreum]
MIVAAFVVSVFALLATAVAALYTRAQARAAKDQVAEARAQTAAATAQAEYAQRSFELEQKRFDREVAQLEEQKTRVQLEEAKERLVRQRLSFEPPPMPWYVSSAGKNAFRVTNGASRTLYDVSLGFDVEPPRVEPREWARIDERASVRVSMFRSLQASPSSVTVRWRDSPDGKLREWTTDLPS